MTVWTKSGPSGSMIVEVEPLQQRQLLQEHRALAPRPALGDGVAAVVVGERRLDRRLPARHVVAGQQPVMAPARRIEHLLGAGRNGRWPRRQSRDTRRRAARSIWRSRVTAAGFAREDAPVGRGECGIAEQLTRLRRAAVGQIDRGRARPVAAEHVGHDADRHADAAGQRVAVLGIARSPAPGPRASGIVP